MDTITSTTTGQVTTIDLALSITIGRNVDGWHICVSSVREFILPDGTTTTIGLPEKRVNLSDIIYDQNVVDVFQKFHALVVRIMSGDLKAADPVSEVDE